MGSIRMTGLSSNLDTESIIKELMAAQTTKKTKIENKKTKLEWTQDIWKSLNTKLNDFTKSLSTMRLQGSYKTKKATTTHDSLVSIIAKKTANPPLGSYELKIKNLATAQKVTGGDVKSKNLTEASKLSEVGVAAGTEIRVTVGQGANEKIRTVEVTADTTINDFLGACKDLGLNANFDTAQGRFFISTNNSGKDGKFKIETSTLSSSSIAERRDLRDSLGYNSLSNSNKLIVDNAIRVLSEGTATEQANAQQKLLDIAKSSAKEETQDAAERYVAAKYEQSYRNDPTLMSAIEDKYKADYYEKDSSGNLTTNLKNDVIDGLKGALRNDAIAAIEGNGVTYPTDQDKQDAIDAYYNNLIGGNGLKDKADQLVKNRTDNELLKRAQSDLKTQAGKDEIDKYKTDGITQADVNALGTDLINKYGVTPCQDEAAAILTKQNDVTNKITQYQNVMSSGAGSPTTGVNALSAIGLDDVNGSAVTSGSTASGMAVVEAMDSEIELDGATLTSNTNEFEVNGLTINLKGIPPAGETISINVSEDTDGIYNMVKDFVKGYNEILKEMNTLYNATSSKGYEPLSDEEKTAMSDSQIEKWEAKIKDSLLRRDGTLDSLTSTMRMSMGATVEVDGQRYSLANLGISTSTDWTERGLLHIYGDEDDPIYKAENNKLLQMLKDDPDVVAKVLSGVTQGLYDSMNKKMRQTSISSTQTFYNDIEMKNQLETYKKDIKKWETKLIDMENRYYKQFSAMEVALSKLNSQSSYLSGLLG